MTETTATHIAAEFVVGQGELLIEVDVAKGVAEIEIFSGGVRTGLAGNKNEGRNVPST